MRVPITFVDVNDNPTNDYIEGRPSVLVNIEVGFQPLPNPSQSFTPNFVKVRAFVDTGSNVTIIRRELSKNKKALAKVPSRNMQGAGVTDFYSALVQVDGLDKPYHIEVGFGPQIPMKMLLGRDMLSKYKMVIDTPRQEFYLERT